MNQEPKGLARLVRDIFDTRDDEIQCDAVQPMMAGSAEAHLSDTDSRQQYPELWRHFRFCPDCLQEYRMLQQLFEMEAAGELARPARIPPLPDGGRRPVWEWAKDAITAVFPGWAPAPALAPTRAAGSTRTVEMTLAEGELALTLDLAPNDQDAGAVDLLCTVLPAAEEQQAALEGAPVWLQMGEDGPAVREGALTELGAVLFARLTPGEYSLRLYLTGQEYGVKGLHVP